MEVKKIAYGGAEITLPRPITIPDECENVNFAIFKAIVEEWNKDILESTNVNKELEVTDKEKQILDILKVNIVDSNVYFGSNFDHENRIRLTIEIYQPKDYIDKTTGNKEIAIFKNKDFDLILNWLKEKYNNV